MEHFKIYILLNASLDNKLLLTNSKNLSSAATFDENFSLEKNDKSTLTFSIADKLDNGEPNPYLEYLLPESVVALDLVDRKPLHASEQTLAEGLLLKYKVKARQPRLNKNMSVWDITCEDYASTVYSKEAAGLSIDKTGTLQELTEEILGISRKNTYYEDLNVNHGRERNSNEGVTGFKDNGAYLSFQHTNLDIFADIPAIPFASFDIPKKMVPVEIEKKPSTVPETYYPYDYDFQFDLLNSSTRIDTTDAPLELIFKVSVLVNGANIEAGAGSFILKDNTVGVPQTITIPFKTSANATKVNLYIKEHSAGNWTSLKEANAVFNISTTNYKITRNKDFLQDQTYEDPLHLNNLQNLALFSNYNNIVGYQNTKMTFTIENSNLYNAIVELAALFEAEVHFDYADNAFYYVNTKARKYRGYKVHPDINLLSISRPESSNDFASILHLRGSDDVNSVIPSLPREWREYFIKCVEESFETENFFKTYDFDATNLTELGSNYTSVAQKYLLPNLPKNEAYYERVTEIMRFASQMDRVPNFDGTIYDFSYFNDNGLMKPADYSNLLDILYNQLRKINITMNVKSYQYYTLMSAYSGQQTQLAYYITGIKNEQRFRYQAFDKLDPVKNPNAPRPYTAAWVSLKNQINASESQELDFKDSMNILLGTVDSELINGVMTSVDKVSISKDSFLFNVFSLFGYDSTFKNGLTHLINENTKALNKKRTEQQEIIKSIDRLQATMHFNTHVDARESLLLPNCFSTRDELISLGIDYPSNSARTFSDYSLKEKEALLAAVIKSPTKLASFYNIISATPKLSFENEALEVELAGQQSKLESSYHYLGFSDGVKGYDGTYQIEQKLLQDLKRRLTNVEVRPQESLYDILFNKEYPNNLAGLKEDLLQELYTKYESFSIEGVYENSEEIDAYGLLEQGLRSFVYFSKPKIEYSVSVIEIGAIDNYEHLPLVEIGEKILLGGGLYKTYQTSEATEYLIVNSFSMNLRDPSSLSLQVTQDDETDRLVKEMFKSLNLVKIQPYKQKSNLVIPIPREIKNSGDFNIYYTMNNAVTEAASPISNNMELFVDMFKKKTVYKGDIQAF